jgi:hypothetical protein
VCTYKEGRWLGPCVFIEVADVVGSDDVAVGKGLAEGVFRSAVAEVRHRVQLVFVVSSGDRIVHVNQVLRAEPILSIEVKVIQKERVPNVSRVVLERVLAGLVANLVGQIASNEAGTKQWG